jgi:hypothetical protein
MAHTETCEGGMPYAKLDSGITTSSVWVEDDAVVRVWVYLLATTVPDGPEWVVKATVPAIARDNFKTPEKIEEILALFEAPDPYSRNPENGGRRIRIEREPRWRIVMLNYQKHREGLKATNAERQATYRAKHRGEGEGITPSNAELHGVTQAEAEAEAEAKKKQRDAAIFEEAWTLYRTKTGRGTKKQETWELFTKLPEGDRAAFLSRMQEWFDKREAIGKTGAFVATAPDPIRYVRHRRWTDELTVPKETAPQQRGSNKATPKTTTRDYSKIGGSAKVGDE